MGGGGAYGADKTEKKKKWVLSDLKRKNGKVVPLELIEVGKNGCIQKKWVLLELINLKKGGFFAAHRSTRTALIWEYTPGIAQDV